MAQGSSQSPPPIGGDDDDEVLAALAEVMAALEQNIRRSKQALAKGRIIASQRAQGQSWGEIALEEERPLIVELVTENLRALIDAGSRLRRVQARALHRDGVTMETIAALFGVTRQRVSRLIRPPGEGTSPEAPGGRGRGRK